MQLNNLTGIDRVLEYKGHEADVSVVFEDKGAYRAFRVHYLEEMRDEYEWTHHSNGDTGVPYVALRAKN